MNVIIPQVRITSLLWFVVLAVIELSECVTDFVEEKLTKKDEIGEPFPDEAPH